ncbi:MAG TPA: hypothetical protein VEW72_10390 [Burkholderiales bacterium]|nr:hypothetical protein [Burkholderiales bacterium]
MFEELKIRLPGADTFACAGSCNGMSAFVNSSLPSPRLAPAAPHSNVKEQS